MSYFDSLTNDWISYRHHLTPVQLFRLALNSTENGHRSANAILQTDTDALVYMAPPYGSGGRATKEELNDILHSNGKVIAAREINYKKNVMSNMRWTNEWINSDGKYNEYLFLLEK